MTPRHTSELLWIICVYLCLSALSVVSAGNHLCFLCLICAYWDFDRDNSSRHARHHQNIIITSHTTFLFSRFTSTLPNTHFVAKSYPAIITFKPSCCLICVLHLSYRIRAPSAPAALAIVPYADMRTMPIRSESNQINTIKQKKSKCAKVRSTRPARASYVRTDMNTMKYDEVWYVRVSNMQCKVVRVRARSR